MTTFELINKYMLPKLEKNLTNILINNKVKYHSFLISDVFISMFAKDTEQTGSKVQLYSR